MANHSPVNVTVKPALDFHEHIAHYKTIVDGRLQSYLTTGSPDLTHLTEAMSYALFAGGKRLRPIVMLAVCEALRGSQEDVIPAACAVEMIHTSSLVIDDLPCMDNAELRRGKPSVHKYAGEATAVLTGFGLLNLAFEILSRNIITESATAYVHLKIINEFARAIGTVGMIGGQYLELDHRGQHISMVLVERIHRYKTGAIFTAALRAAGLLAHAPREMLVVLQRYGDIMGLMFQIVDDLLDVVGSADDLGKDTHQDDDKTTFMSIYSQEEIHRLIDDLSQQAIDILQPFGERGEVLRQMVHFAAHRRN